MSGPYERELSIPDGVEPESEDSLELVRIWWQGDRPKMIIRPALRDPAIVAAMLAELAYHFSKAFEDRKGIPQAEALEAIKKGWTEAHAYADTQKDGAK